MTYPIRSILALTILVIVLAACSTTIGAPASETPVPSEPAAPSVQPSVQPSVEPSVEPSVQPSVAPEPAEVAHDVAGTITLFEGTWSGPGATIQEVLDFGDSGEYPTLANGVLFRDTDGKIYLATAVSNVSAPTFDGPMLEVVGLRNEGPEWDMANAELLLLEEANGIIFRQNSQILGFLDVR
jgi:hypothetical protein